ncbi:D-Ala-D-Ala carboxypeptidase family metallohydrolase [Spirosoma foliorum]|uniref:Peptidase M15 n=1 Tax=Spirosoma foliorum TaxID=2710596 RepID=A0A7G5H2L9_9BACT|nr:D-Ala-D-Ala carboxypeptidase family metallohydrolase [Spirosoma foliorum]QMW05361.1 peptidase M15 [Spirosoma foliorum]
MPQNPIIAPSIPVVFPDFGKLLTYNESVKSATAIRKGIANVPNADQYKNMVRVYNDFYVPICTKFGKLPVSSFFRSLALNKAIGGATTSAHMSGNAIDLDCDGLGRPTNLELFNWCRANLHFDQLILENPDQHNNPSWVHIANNRDGQPNRGQVLRMIRKGSKTIYEAI